MQEQSRKFDIKRKLKKNTAEIKRIQDEQEA